MSQSTRGSLIIKLCAWSVTSVVSNTLQPHGLYSPWNSLGQNTGVGSLSLLQGIFPTQGSNQRLLHCRQILYCWATNQSVWKYSEMYVQCFNISLLEVDFCFFVLIASRTTVFNLGIPGARISRVLDSHADSLVLLSHSHLGIRPDALYSQQAPKWLQGSLRLWSTNVNLSYWNQFPSFKILHAYSKCAFYAHIQ